jgi:hypothetical protein
MRQAIGILCALLLIPLLGISSNCSSGKEPETVIVPVGEPSADGSDPYGSGGALGCGGSSAAAVTLTDQTSDGESMVLLIFKGANDLWLTYVKLSEFRALQTALEQVYDAADFTKLKRADVDRWHGDLCAPPAQQSQDAKTLYDIFRQVLGSDLAGMEADVCD